ncbi:MAG TPA: hypothetical protein PLH19_02255 [Anaerolineae bacterium]|nr:hypothetical protein [Anaerolineae bacterium]HQH37346.1 hypothetical protein [Anaerolineae bacterium]
MKLFNNITIKPYMADKEIAIVEEVLLKLRPTRCLEWGSGYSTLYFSHLLPENAQWIAVEHDRVWQQFVVRLMNSTPLQERRGPGGWHRVYLRGQLTKIGFSTLDRAIRIFKKRPRSGASIEIFNIVPNHFPWSDSDEDGCYADLKDYVEFPTTFGPFDFILVDGRARKDCLIQAHAMVKDTGVVVLHDANREYYNEPLGLYPYQALFTDVRQGPGGGLWIGSKELNLENVVGLEKHCLAWKP